MAIKWASEARRTDLESFDTEERLYIDFRQKVYPPLSGHDLTFTAHTSGANKCGSHYLSGGNAYYLLAMPSTFILSIELKPGFAYDVASNQNVCGWYVDANTYWVFRYNKDDDKFEVEWKDGGTARKLSSRQFDDGGSYEDIDQWMRFDIIFDSTTGDTTGGKLYYNRTADDEAWSGNIDGKTHTFPKFEVRSLANTEGTVNINFIRLFSSVTTDDVANDHKGREEEEIWWPMNGCGLGRTRCNVSRLVRYYFIEKNIGGANLLMADLDSSSHQFADDQYSAFAPASESFNGLTTQRYLQARTPVILEHWYSHEPELLFVGRVNEDFYQRSSPRGGRSQVRITAEDAVSEIGRRIIRKGRTYQGYDICDTTTESESLLHVIARLALQYDVVNFLANSSFENATIANSWTASGGTLTREEDPLIGTYCGQLAADDSSDETLTQIITFTGTRKLNVGEKWNFSIYLKSTSGATTANIGLYEDDSGGNNDGSTQEYDLAGTEGYEKWEVTHTITDTDSDRLRVVINVKDGETVKLDCAMLIQDDVAIDWFVLNDNDGSSGTESADDADSASYDTVGFDADDAAITHPYAQVKEGEPVWSCIKDLAEASLARYYGIDSNGTFVFKPRIDAPADPSSLLTISAAEGLQSQLQLEQANKFIVHGVRVLVGTTRRLAWSAQSARLFGDDGPIAIELSDADTWPDPSTYGELWAEYDEEAKGAAIPGSKL